MEPTQKTCGSSLSCWADKTMRHFLSQLSQAVLVIMVTGPLRVAPDLGPIVFVSDGRLCSISESTVAKSVCLERPEQFGAPSWRPDGSALVVEAGRHDGPQSLLVLDRTGRTTVRLAGSSEHIRPAWSADGRYVFAISYTIGRAVARWDANGKNRTVVPVTGGGGGSASF